MTAAGSGVRRRATPPSVPIPRRRRPLGVDDHRRRTPRADRPADSRVVQRTRGRAGAPRRRKHPRRPGSHRSRVLRPTPPGSTIRRSGCRRCRAVDSRPRPATAIPGLGYPTRRHRFRGRSPRRTARTRTLRRRLTHHCPHPRSRRRRWLPCRRGDRCRRSRRRRRPHRTSPSRHRVRPARSSPRPRRAIPRWRCGPRSGRR